MTSASDLVIEGLAADVIGLEALAESRAHDLEDLTLTYRVALGELHRLTVALEKRDATVAELLRENRKLRLASRHDERQDAA
ncbi:MAG: hypothetical protein ACE148_14460 [Vicinamibacterales bacterium]